ncbi:hypothetical protein PO883_17360 [Massilia sp. DJPM01]|uniref:hypothetical protein n=1 Tax=Massilia sp. DJPM01 TaxID=3024404 RepID=UPI00259E6543|nr:hypothetical protein [Massilia sp. DJPM01]MDM5178972.1 hypothetical protein [Massilia sp. DJPM01]
MNSPYTPPATLFLDERRTPSAIRMCGVAIFAALPLLGMIIMQGQHLYTNKVWFAKSVNIFEPIFLMFPMVIVTAASGYAFALACARASKRRVVSLGIAVGTLWSICALLTGNAMLYLKFDQAPGPLYQQAGLFLSLAALLLPLGIAECALVRLYGKPRDSTAGNTR